jgi:hypothetical protein
MKLSLTLHDKTHTVQDDIPFDHYTVDELLDMFKGLLVSAGFHPSTVDRSIDIADGNWFTDEERNLCDAWNEMSASDPNASTKRDNFDDKIEAGSNHETDPS